MTPTNPPSTTTTPIKALDSLMRRELNIADPNDANEVAQALLKRYSQDARAMALEREAAGLPGFALPQQPARPAAATPAGELEQATGDVETDLNTLRTNTVLKHIAPEIDGWSDAIQGIIADGGGAAPLALDRHQRDRTMAARRRLGDYARAARLVGLLTPHANQEFRALARSLDSVANLWLVIMGEALADFSSDGGHALLSAPLTELQVRKQAVINSLRSMVGAAQNSFDSGAWPRGMSAYMQALLALDDWRRNDLASIFVESELERSLDELIQRAGAGSSRSLRSLGATARLELERFRNLITVLANTPAVQAPPMTAFLNALVHFIQAFQPAGGERLARIAQAPILAYGSRRAVGASPAETRLSLLTMQRAFLAANADCLLDCGCNLDLQVAQAVIDVVLYCVDRAIDLYAFGNIDFGPAEQRASAYWLVLEQARAYLFTPPPAPPAAPGVANPPLIRSRALLPRLALPATFRNVNLRPIQNLLRPGGAILPNQPNDPTQPVQEWERRNAELLPLWTQECDLAAPLPTMVRAMVDECVPLTVFWDGANAANPGVLVSLLYLSVLGNDANARPDPTTPLTLFHVPPDTDSTLDTVFN